MEFKVVTNENKEIFQKTYITALTEGFVDFVPKNWIAKFNKEFELYYNECLNNEDTEMWLCYENNKPIGVLVFGKSAIQNSLSTDAILDSIYFRKNYHGKGLAKIALNFIETKLKEKGYSRIQLWCSKENNRAWQFYIKNGYSPTLQKWDDTLDGKVFHNILFEKII